MPSIEANKLTWEQNYDWAEGGSEWSRGYGGVDMQWFGSVLPRIHSFVPTGTILEIAPGFGRWTEFLRSLCQQLILVDLSPKCIEACRARFNDCKHITYHVNDGKSLAMVADDSVDFVFSFDSLVHVEAKDMKIYLGEIRRKLTPDGVGFIHHSNLGEYRGYLRSNALLARYAGRLRTLLARLKLIEILDVHWRADLSAQQFHRFAEQAGLVCLSQERINWGSRRLIDCISVITRKDSRWARSTQSVANPAFVREQAYLSMLARLYGTDSFQRP